MSVVTRQFSTDGPLISIEISLPSSVISTLRQKGMAVPPPVSLTALIDTGSNATVIDTNLLTPLIAAGLQMSFIKLANVPSVHTPKFVVEYRVGLRIEPAAGQPRGGLVLASHPVFEDAIGALGYDALIGRDVLEKCALFIDGPASRFTLSF